MCTMVTVFAASKPGWNPPTALPTGGAASWVDARGGEVPANAVHGGFDSEQLYVGRASHEGALIPGKIVPSHGVCYIAWGGQEHGKEEYQVSLLTPWYGSLLESWLLFIRSRNFKGSSVCSQKPAIGPYPEPDESDPYLHTVSFQDPFLGVHALAFCWDPFLGVLHTLAWAKNTLWACPCLSLSVCRSVGRSVSRALPTGVGNLHDWGSLLCNSGNPLPQF
jgi:hypothetical protein